MRRQSGGYILVQALVVVAGLVALVVMMAADQRASMQEIQTRLRERRAEAAADAGVARALAVLQAANSNIVTLNDDWALQGHNGVDQFNFSDDSANYRMEIVDAASLINLNTAAQAQLNELPLDPDQVDSLLDWIQTGTQPRSDGAKDSFYNALPQPYNTKLGPLTTVNELCLVDNWTAQTLYQPPLDQTPANWPTDQNGNELPMVGLFTVDSGAPNTQISGGARLDIDARVSVQSLMRLGINSAIATNIANASPIPSFQRLFSLPGMTSSAMQILLNDVTFSTSTRTTGLINLNTASQAVLQTLPSMNAGAASAIASEQSSGFPSLGELAALPGISRGQMAQIADSVSVGSDTWIVRVYGQSGISGGSTEVTNNSAGVATGSINGGSGAGVADEVVVRLTNGAVQIINWEHLNTSSIPSWWDWPAQSTSTFDAGDNQ